MKQAIIPITGDGNLFQRICAGAISGAIGAAIASPTDLIKVRDLALQCFSCPSVKYTVLISSKLYTARLVNDFTYISFLLRLSLHCAMIAVEPIHTLLFLQLLSVPHSYYPLFCYF